jgi:predicted phage terminase large subunit-like protein
MNKQPKKQNNEGEDVFKKITTDRVLRRQIGYESHQLFFTMYFPNYLKHPTAEFQKDILRITEDQSNQLACIAAFRGSGKSTLVTFSYALWAILGVQQKKFVLLICQTRAQARQHMANLKNALEQNQLLKSDMGPFQEDAGNNEWALSSLVFQNTGARIMVASVDQSIRGVRHREHRPDVIILDDIEDINSVRTFEGRNKVAEWYSREVVPLGDLKTRIIILANLLHEDSFVMRLKQKIDDKEVRGIYKWFPLIDDDGKCLWPEKFDTQAKIDELHRSVGNEIAWTQEFLLKITSDASRVVDPDWLQYYEGPVPQYLDDPGRLFAAADLAISQNERADCTAVVTARVRRVHGERRIYILPNPINKRMSFPDTIDCFKTVITNLKSNGKLFIETTGFQEAYFQELIKDGCSNIKGIKPMSDKRTRLAMTASLIENGTIIFPEEGCEELIAQITNFGIERHDDLADAFSMLIEQVVEEGTHGTGTMIVAFNSAFPSYGGRKFWKGQVF